MFVRHQVASSFRYLVKSLGSLLLSGKYNICEMNYKMVVSAKILSIEGGFLGSANSYLTLVTNASYSSA